MIVLSPYGVRVGPSGLRAFDVNTIPTAVRMVLEIVAAQAVLSSKAQNDFILNQTNHPINPSLIK